MCTVLSERPWRNNNHLAHAATQTRVDQTAIAHTDTLVAKETVYRSSSGDGMLEGAEGGQVVEFKAASKLRHPDVADALCPKGATFAPRCIPRSEDMNLGELIGRVVEH